MRRGGFGKSSSDQPKKEVPITPVMTVLHPFTRVVVGLAFTAGGIWGLFTWNWKYVAAGLFVVAGGLIVGPWIWPHEKVRIDLEQIDYRKELDLGDDEVHL